MGRGLSPERALFQGERPLPLVPACDHYAGNERFMLKALALQAQHAFAFDVTFDLEDGAVAGSELAQRQLVLDLLNDPRNASGRVGVRIHDHASPWWRSDIEALVKGAGRRLAHITIPKSASARQVAEVITCIQNACAVAELGREIPIHVLIETHTGLADAARIARLPWVRGLDFGLMDFVSEHQGAIPLSALRAPGQFEHALIARAKADLVAAALAHGLVPTHNVTIDIDDPARVAADARRARREFGFLRMWSIHPSQIEPIVAAFAPEDDAVDLACAVLVAARAADWGPVRHDGLLYDRASYRSLWQLLRRARQAGRALSDEAVARLFDD